MDNKNLVERYNSILEHIAEVHQRQQRLKEDYEVICTQVMNFKQNLISVDDECQALYDQCDEFGNLLNEFTEKFWTSPVQSPVLAGYSQEPYEDVQQSSQEETVQTERPGAVYSIGNLQPKANVQTPLPVSGVKEVVLRPDTVSKSSVFPETGLKSSIFVSGESSNPDKQKIQNFQKRKTVSFSIEKPLTKWESDYFEFAKTVYELDKGRTFFRLQDNKPSIYPRVTCVHDCPPNFVKKLADYGFLDRIYPSKDLHELTRFPTSFQKTVKEFSQGENIYLRFYSISPEIENQTIYEPFHLITMGFITSVQLTASEAGYKMPFFNHKWMTYRRALGIKVIGNLCKEFLEKGFVTYDHEPGWMIIMPYEENFKDKILEEKLIQINLDRWPSAPGTIKEACRLLKHRHQQVITSKQM